MTTTHTVPLDADQRRHLLRADRLGAAGERLTADHLVDDGFEVLARGWRVADGPLRGELDVVAVDRDCLVVCEVKTRRDAARFDGAVAAVDARKLARLRRLTGAFLRDADTVWRRVRLDVVAVDVAAARLTHLVGVP